jgi:hypothetical protein
MSKKDIPKLAGAIFCNSASKDPGGKINCRAIFTSFLAWAYPTSLRKWFNIITLHHLPKGTTSLSVAISYGRGKKTTLATADVERGKVDVGNVVYMPVQYQFKKEGFYTVHFSIIESTTILKVPLKVTTKPWPRITKRQIQYLKEHSSVPNSARITILCASCSRPYNLEESVLPDAKLAGGILPFPDTGKFECEDCGHILHVKDFQGQLRDSIKNTVNEAIRGG